MEKKSRTQLNREDQARRLAERNQRAAAPNRAEVRHTARALGRDLASSGLDELSAKLTSHLDSRVAEVDHGLRFAMSTGLAALLERLQDELKGVVANAVAQQHASIIETTEALSRRSAAQQDRLAALEQETKTQAISIALLEQQLAKLTAGPKVSE